MIGLKRTSKLEIMTAQTDDKYKSPYGDHEWQEGYDIWEHGFDRGAQWMLEKAADWIEEYLGEGNTIDDWCRDSKVLENGREKFFKDLKEE